MYKCKTCGHIFEEGEQATWTEKHGFSSGPYEEWSGCPICNEPFEEAKRCKICNGVFLESELNGNAVCNVCLEDYYKDFDTCYAIADTEKEEIKINALLFSLLDITDIETILYRHLKEQKDIDCSFFINQDKDWFAEKIIKRLENDRI